MRTRTLGLVAILLAVFVDLLGVTIVTVALPSITTDLDASAAQAQAVLSGYTLTFAVGLITGARLGRLLGLRRAFVIGVVGFTLASLACGLADAAWLLVAARVIQGLFAALMVPQVLAFIQLMYEPSERAKPMAAFSALLGIAAAAGPILGGVLIALDRQERGADARSPLAALAEDEGIPTIAVATLADVIAYARVNGLGAEQIEAIEGYRARYGV